MKKQKMYSNDDDFLEFYAKIYKRFAYIEQQAKNTKFDIRIDKNGSNCYLLFAQVCIQI